VLNKAKFQLLIQELSGLLKVFCPSLIIAAVTVKLNLSAEATT